MKNTKTVGKFNSVKSLTRQTLINSDSISDKINAILNFRKIFKEISPYNYWKQPSYLKMIKLLDDNIKTATV